MNEKNYDSTIIRVAGNLLSGRRSGIGPLPDRDQDAVKWAVAMARAIVAETLCAPAPQEPKQEPT